MMTEGSTPPPREALADRLGYRFRDPALLALALTHASARGARSASAASNERLEFLGDRVLGLTVAALLYRRFPDEPEGALAQRHAVLVSKQTLSAVAERMHLGPFIVASRSEKESGGTSRSGILADTCEAIIGAMFLDGGLEAASAFVEAHWSDLVSGALMPPKDPKTELQEWAQGRGFALPTYREVKRQGPPHSPEFWMEVSLPGLGSVGASGASKRGAEQAAAKRLLAGLKANEQDDDRRAG
jgi:ribonuclease-3